MLDDAVAHTKAYLQKHPIVPGDEIRGNISRLSEIADSLDPDQLLEAVQYLS